MDQEEDELNRSINPYDEYYDYDYDHEPKEETEESESDEEESSPISWQEALPALRPLEPAGMPEPSRLDQYDRDYPDRDDPAIQSLIAAKFEFAECKCGPNPMEDVRVDRRFFNNQVFYQRLMTAYGSCALFFEMGSGKTGCIECFRTYTEKFKPGTVSKYYYVTNKVQQLEFKYQITQNFASESVREEFAAAALKKGLNYLRVERNQKKIAKDYLKEKMIETREYLWMSNYIDSMDNDRLIEVFGRAAVFVDEVQFIKITEDVDSSVKAMPARPVSGVRYERQRMKIYKSFWRLTHVCPSCIFSVMTGRPMTKDFNELIYILNLLPNTTQIETPLSKKIAESMNDPGLQPKKRVDISKLKWADVDLASRTRTKELEAVARGRIMYIRAPDTGAFKDYDSKTKSRTVSYFRELGRTVTLVSMHAFQAATYSMAHSTMMAARDKEVRCRKAGAKLREEQDTLHHNTLQSLVFAIPSEEYMNLRINGTVYKNIREDVRRGYIGKDHFHHIAERRTETYMRELTTENYTKKKIERGDNMTLTREVWTPKEIFNRCVRTDILGEFSAKILDLVKNLEREDEGLTYLASHYDSTTGGILGWILEARGFERFRPAGLQWAFSSREPPIGKKLRYAPMTSDNKDEHQGILSLARHPANWKGEYLRIIAASPVTTVGVNVGNSWRMVLLDPLPTEAAIEQATARVFRPNAHKEIMKKLSVTRFGVKVVYYIAELPGDNNHPTIDWSMYQRLYQRGKAIAKVSRAIKRISIDFAANIERNIRPDDLSYSPEVDYMKSVVYGPYETFQRLPADTSTYDAYYARNSLDRVIRSLANVISSVDFSAVNIATVLNLFSTYVDASFSRTEVLFGLRYIIEHRMPLGMSRLGFPVYLEENEGTLYSTTSLNQESDKMLSYYYPMNTILQTASLEQQSYDLMGAEALQEDIRSLELLTLDQVRVRLLGISSLVKGKLFEIASTEQQDERWSNKLMEALCPLWITVEAESAVVHQITNLFHKGSNFGAVEFILKANTRLRVYKRGEWRWCNPGETEAYSKLLNAKLEAQMKPYYDQFASAGFMGLIIRPDDIHIRNIVTDKATRARTGDKGKRVSGFSLQDLVGMLYDMGCSPAHGPKMARGAMIEVIKREFKGISTAMLANFANNKLMFFYQKAQELKNVKNAVSRVSLDLCQCMASKRAIYALVGTVPNTLTRMNATPPLQEEEEGDSYDFDDA